MSEQSLVKKRRRSVYRIRGKFFDFSCALPAIIFFVILLVIKFVFGYNISMVWITVLTLAYGISEFFILRLRNK